MFCATFYNSPANWGWMRIAVERSCRTSATSNPQPLSHVVKLACLFICLFLCLFVYNQTSAASNPQPLSHVVDSVI